VHKRPGSAVVGPQQVSRNKFLGLPWYFDPD
jgi:hypothetical protein